MKHPKGTQGYIKEKRVREIVKTILFFGISLAVFFTGYLQTGTRNNLLTVAAILGCLPAGKSFVSMVMILRAIPCSESMIEQLKNHFRQSCHLFLYDLYLTDDKKSYQLSTVLVRNKIVLAYSEDASCDIGAGEKHIGKYLRMNGCNDWTVKIFGIKEADKFLDRAEKIIGDKEEPGQGELDAMGVLLSLSL